MQRSILKNTQLLDKRKEGTEGNGVRQEFAAELKLMQMLQIQRGWKRTWRMSLRMSWAQGLDCQCFWLVLGLATQCGKRLDAALYSWFSILGRLSNLG